MKYININQELKFKFFQVPRKILYTEPYKSILCPLSQLGYIFILDRLNLSRMNHKVDDYGNIYIFITRKEMGEYLKSSSKTVIKVFKELEKAKLIKQENQGKGKAYKIYVVDIYSEDEQKEKLHITNEKDKKFMSQDKANKIKKSDCLNKELEKIPYNLNWLKDSIEKLIKDYVEMIDFESYYFHKKYYFAGLKDGMKLKEELK